ncbi:5,10-methylenetetrahydrofolate reductase-like [Ylistrum balloti]|uniref:5,10-methylenetetrahydrofolate reductase-like n=1 Tax=Ylistrum balloti TaxID=509963 RepID=UPI002905AA0A|nr:5,10-methylenetetrahydrofolate reductase-like [Ylistrum balloti]
MKQDIQLTEFIHDPQCKYTIEVYPPRDANDKTHLIACLQRYSALGVRIVNITCQSDNIDSTLYLLSSIRKELPELILVPHINAYALVRDTLDHLVHEYEKLGISNLFLIRGDIEEKDREFFQTIHASDLVEAVRKKTDQLCIGVAGYPEQHFEEPNFFHNMQHLKEKVDKGASYVTTQLFFNNEYYFDFVKRCRVYDIQVPIIPGITFLKNKKHAEKLLSLVQGTSVPAGLLTDIFHAKSDAEAYARGAKWCREQVHDLLVSNVVPQVHFYTFNRLEPFDKMISEKTDKKQTVFTSISNARKDQ